MASVSLIPQLAALELSDRILSDLDKGNTPLAIYLDLSKAFDTLNHSILLKNYKFMVLIKLPLLGSIIICLTGIIMLKLKM